MLRGSKLRGVHGWRGLTEVSIIHHAALVLFFLWISASFGWSHPFLYFISLLYLYQVYERYALRLQRRIQFEERKCANQRRLLIDSESVRWLNQVVEKVWPICMEDIASRQFLLPIIPWFLDKYKPWTAKKAVVQHLYLGRSPPLFTEIRVRGDSDGDDHLVLELGMNFLSADDMDAVLAVKLRKRLGFGMWAKLHVTSIHVEGKVLVGVKFIQHWPFLGRVRVCFVGPPYFQMTVKPIFHHGVDVTEIPGIAGWLDKLLALAFEQTLVEPNMLVVDVEKFASAQTDGWFTVDEKHPIAFVKVEIVEAAYVKPSEGNGLSDPYVKGQLGSFRFRTKTQKKTLSPKWHEEFKVPITSWEAPNVLDIQVRDKDRIFDDMLGECSVNIYDLRGGQRHDKWLTLRNIKSGRLHLAITVLDGEYEKNSNGVRRSDDEGLSKMTVVTPSPQSGLMAQDYSNRDLPLHEKNPSVLDKFEPIDIPGQQMTGIWVHHPGRDTPRTWEPREGCDYADSPGSVAFGCSDTPRDDECIYGNNKFHGHDKVRRGLHKIGLVLHKSSASQGVSEEGLSVRSAVDDCHAGNVKEPVKGEGGSPRKGHMRGRAKRILKQVGKSAENMKGAARRKVSERFKGHQVSYMTEDPDGSQGSSSSDEDSPLSFQRESQ